MNSSPFELFRRNLKPLMVLLVGLAMFAFIVLPVLDQYLRKSAGGTDGDIVASFNGRDLTRGRVSYFTQNHQSTVRFLVELAQETINRGGSPQTAGFQYDMQSQQVRAIGINEVPSQMGSIRSLMLASLAQNDGFDLDDNALQVWLSQYTDGKITDGDINAMLLRSTQNRMGRPHLYQQLRTHLLAQVYEQRGISGLFLGSSPMAGPLLTPQEQWENFLKLNQNAIVGAYGISVDDYLPETTAEPSEIEIKKVYDEGKDRDPSEFSPDPGFHRQYVAKVEYVVGDLQTFIDAEVAKLSEEEIRAEYDRRIKGGDFLLPTESAPVETGGDTPDAEEPAEQAPEGSPEESAPEESSESIDVEASEESDAPASTTEQSDQQEGEPSPDDQSSVQADRAVRLVTAFTQQADEEAEQEPADPQPASEEGQGTESATNQDKAVVEEDAEDLAAETQVETAAEEDSAGGEATSEAEETATETEAVESFEAVRDQVAADMVRSAAQIRMSDAIQKVNDKMKRFFGQNAMYENSISIQGDTGKKPPTRPNLEELAAEYGLTYEVIGPYSATAISERSNEGQFIEPIAGSVALGSMQSGQNTSFVQLAYGSSSAQSQEPSLPLFAPISTVDAQAITPKQYLAWKVEEKAAYTPELDEVRDEVIMAIRVQEARELATKAAEQIAKQAEGKENVELKDLVPEDKMEAFQEGLGPFTWMTAFGFSGASLGVVPGIEAAGSDFMEAIFTNPSGTVSVAADQSGRTVYVIQSDSFQPGMDELREQFKQPTNRFMSMMLGNGANQIVGGYFEKMDKQNDFEDYTSAQE